MSNSPGPGILRRLEALGLAQIAETIRPSVNG